MIRKPMVIAYDISDNKRRRQVFNVLKRWRLDGQKSVHECFLTSRQAEELLLQLGPLIDQTTDCLLFAWVDRKRGFLWSGKKPLTASGMKRIN